LYFELSGAVVAIPPLRNRLDDLPQLMKSILRSLGRPEVTVSDDVRELLAQRTWPGNVRELKSTLACALAFVEAGELERRHLQLSPPSDNTGELERLPLGGQPLEHIERAAIKQTLAQMGGVKSRAAQALGIAVSTLYEKLKKYGL
jgi:transcriptional regulator of acetoin/glycerol metabolism